MTSQRFELEASIGGFTPEEVAKMPKKRFEERGDRDFPIPLLEQAATVQRGFDAFLDAVHDSTEHQKFGRKLLLEEGLMNVVIHGNGGDAELRSVARLTVEKHQTQTGTRIACILMLDDHSPTFDMDVVPDPTDTTHLEIPKGRGLLLIRAIGKATIAQIPRTGGKTMVYSWNEQSEPVKIEDQTA